MADIPVVQEAPEQEKKGNEGFCIRIIRTNANGNIELKKGEKGYVDK